MKSIRRIVALTFLISLLISGCSAKEEPSESTTEETPTETTEELDREYLLDDTPRREPIPDSYYDIDVSGMDYNEMTYTYVPTDVYEELVGYITDYIDAGGDSVEGNTYIGREDRAALDEVINYGDPYSDIGVAYEDLNCDGVCELLILDLNYGAGYRILQVYTYNPEYGVCPVLHSTYSSSYFLTPYGWLFVEDYSGNNEVIAEYYLDSNSQMRLVQAVYLAEVNGVEHVFSTSYENYIGSIEADGEYVCDLNSLYDNWSSDQIWNDKIEECRYEEYDYNYIIPLSNFCD